MATKRPPKRGAALPRSRAIDRLQPADRERVKANVSAFLAYVAMRQAQSVKQLV